MGKLKPKKVKPRMRVLKAIKYNGHMVYVRQVNEDIFMYDLVFDNQIYSSYLVITPETGKTKLTKEEVRQAGDLIYQGAMSTIDTLLGVELDNKTKETAQRVINTKIN